MSSPARAGTTSNERQRGPPPSKKPTTKAERRALQEQQRAAKAAAGGNKTTSSTKGQPSQAPPSQQQQQQQQQSAPPPPAQQTKKSGGSDIVGHLTSSSKGVVGRPIFFSDVHPSIGSLGLKFASGEIDGANDRCVAMLSAFKQVIRDYECPSDAAISRDLDKKLKPLISFLIECRPHSVSMGAAIKHVRAVVSRLPPDTTENDAKEIVCDEIDAFVRERVELPAKVVSSRAAEKIRDGDVVVTFGSGGDSVRQLFQTAAVEQGKKFSVIVVDSRPQLRGRHSLIPFLHSIHVETTYVLLSAVNYAMRHATTFVVAAEAVYSNGAALAHAGIAAVALVAFSKNVPVLVCAETYKFHAKVQLDSLSWNELGDPKQLAPPPSPGGENASSSSSSAEPTSKRHNNKTRVNSTCFSTSLRTKYITAFITEHGLVPPSACAALVRELDLIGTREAAAAAASAAPTTGRRRLPYK